MLNLPSSILNSIHGDPYGRDEELTSLDQHQRSQLFASREAIQFPLPESEAWTEKVKQLIDMVIIRKMFLS